MSKLHKNQDEQAQNVPSTDILQAVADNRVKVVNEAVERVLSLQTSNKLTSAINEGHQTSGGVSPYKLVSNAAQRLKEFEAKSIQAIEDIYKAVTK